MPAGRLVLSLAVLPFLTATISAVQAPSVCALEASNGDSSALLSAQNQTTPADPQGGQPPDSSENPEKKPLKVNPITDLATSSATNYVPLTPHDRWKLYWRQMYSPGAYFGPIVTASVLDQATDSPPQWGPAIGGYGRRVVSRVASSLIQETVEAPVAALLHEDVRYIASPRHRWDHRALHAIEYSVVTYNNSGRPTPNIANLSGVYASTAISGTWLPGNQSLARYTFTNGTEQIGVSMAVNILQEFWPDIRRSVFHRHPH